MVNFITISAPSGSGKTTLCKALQIVEPDIQWSISYTTREKRDIEEDGIDYHFISSDKFEDFIINGYFIEWENVHGDYYGTPKTKLNNSIKSKEIVLLELDVNGTTSIQKLYPDHSYSIFIVPPSIEHLRERLKNRGSETDKIIEKRLTRFNEEMMYKDQFDTLLINDNIRVAINDFIMMINKITKTLILLFSLGIKIVIQQNSSNKLISINNVLF